jgi:hypothetical protein
VTTAGRTISRWSIAAGMFLASGAHAQDPTVIQPVIPFRSVMT